MAGVSNSAFRTICFEFGAGLVYSEMISDKAIHYRSKKTLKMIRMFENEHPLSMQIFGSSKSTMVEAAKYIEANTDCDIIDINMGCPVTKIIKSNAGSALMKDIDKAVDIAKSVVEAVNLPVTVKMRLGWTKETINCVELSKKLEEVGVKAIAVHGRTKGQMYEGEPDFSWVKKVKESVSIPVLANGNINSVEKAKEVIGYTGCDGVMIGRAAIGDPFFIKELVSYYNNEEVKKVTYDERINMAISHAKRLSDLIGENYAMKQMRGLASWYITGMPYSARIKNQTSRLNTLDDLKKLYFGYLSDIKKYEREYSKEV
ncbi:MAG: tRNA dihydrouridine synthase DusB [Erysipelotrichaceae bacterium]|jgi:nifR3 family TIM-barrel protein|nr:tRNA dihydrouridine synthase DusB [Erysipelotrichaceae bacterium]